jgi:hypothetical protein
VTGEAQRSSVQLLLYGFGPDAEFEGRLVGALQRIESGGTLRVLDALFLRSDAETGELDAISLAGDGAGSIVAPLLGFRLDAAERRRASARALDPASGEAGRALLELGGTLAPGAAVAAVLVEHVWADALQDAVSRTGGIPLADEFVDATALSELAPDLVAAAAHRGDRAPGA